jgi:hypothetical protein
VGTTLVFPEPYITRVSDDDAGKNGVFSLTLLNNNGTFEIFPNVAERKANFIIRVRDNHMLDFEEFTALSFQVSHFISKLNAYIQDNFMNDSKRSILSYRFLPKN